MSNDEEQVLPDVLEETAALPAPNSAATHIVQGAPSEASAVASEPHLSKNAQRRLRRVEKQAALKVARKLKDKEKKAEKKRKREEAIANGEPPEPPRKRPRPAPLQQTKFNATVVIDLGFDDKMTEKEVMSLCSQMSYTYGANRKAPTTFAHLAFASLNGQTEKRMEDGFHGTHKKWRGVDWWADGYEHLWKEPDDAQGESADEPPAKPEAPLLKVAKESIVYLTADGDEEISELKEGETYIIGGIVDRNRYKNLCRDKAMEQGIRAARLPIGTFLSELPTRKVLTVNQVVDIMLMWLENRNWREAFWKQIPKRKFQGKERTDAAEAAEDDTGLQGSDYVDEGSEEDPEDVALSEEALAATENTGGT